MEKRNSRIKYRLISLLLSLILLLGTISTIPIVALTVEDETEIGFVRTFYGDGYEIEYRITNGWGDIQWGLTRIVDVKITNTGDKPIENWMLEFDDFCGDIQYFWSGAMFAETEDGFKYIKNNGYNSEITPGNSFIFTYPLENPTGAPGSITMIQERVAVNPEDYAVSVIVDDNWGDLFNGHIVIENLTDKPLEYWELTIDTNFTIDEIANSWTAPTVKFENGVYMIKGTRSTYTHNIEANGSIVVGFVGTMSVTPVISSSELTEVVVNTKKVTVFEHDGYIIEYEIVDIRSDTQDIVVTITNTGDEVIENWMLAYNRFYGNVEDIWGAVISQVECNIGFQYEDWMTQNNIDLLESSGADLSPNYVMLDYIRNTGDNASIEPGQSVSFGYTLTEAVSVPDLIVMCQKRAEIEDYSVSVEIDDVSGSALTGRIVLENRGNESLEFWELFISGNFTIDEIDDNFACPPSAYDDYGCTIKGLESENTHTLEAVSNVSVGFNGVGEDYAEIFDSGLTASVVDDNIIRYIALDSAALQGRPYCCGDVNGDGKVTINDVLEILKYLAGMDSSLTNSEKAENANEVTIGKYSHKAFRAGVVMRNENRKKEPIIGDVLEILKYLSGMNGALDDCECKRRDYTGKYTCNPAFAEDDVVVIFNPGKGQNVEPRSVTVKNTDPSFFASYGGSFPIPKERYITVTFNPNGGQVSTINKDVEWKFIGWYENNPEIIENNYRKVENDIVLHAKWGAPPTVSDKQGELPIPEREYTVKFMSKGKEIGTETTKWEFMGWYTSLKNGIEITNNSNINSNMTLYAVWSNTQPKLKSLPDNPQRTATIKFNANGGTLKTEKNTKEVKSEFNGWQATVGGVLKNIDLNTSITSNITATAQWGRFEVGELPIPTRNNHIFKGWFTRANGGTKISSEHTFADDNVEFFAQWEEAIWYYDMAENHDRAIGFWDARSLNVYIRPVANNADFENGMNRGCTQWSNALGIRFNVSTNAQDEETAQIRAYAGTRAEMRQLSGNVNFSIGLSSSFYTTDESLGNINIQGTQVEIRKQLSSIIYVELQTVNNRTISTAMHEMGHSLGYYGHAPNTTDVMFTTFAGVTNAPITLQDNEMRHLRQIYANYRK
ncbi:MAG: InlB B-repeat-containing protein [Chitinispirillales bacterium]|jgi:uncharacterized repeat protein (TIGR02543 family)|nr:InlB B-repeat-containing protein [Chitinispirillales bacterium]